MDKVLVAEMGVEGGRSTISGNQSEGVWSWTEGSSMDLDDNDDEVWRSWSSQPVSTFDLVVPHDWPVFYPSKIHADFVECFRGNYEQARSTLSEDQLRYQTQYRHQNWLNPLGLPS